MLYFPDQRYQRLFSLLTHPLPRLLLPWLYARGLGVWVLPKDLKGAHQLVHGHLGITQKKLPKDNRKRAETAHYDSRRRIIVLPYRSMVSPFENVALHEIGHAVDYLYYQNGSLLSSQPGAAEALQADKPLNDYCARKRKKTGSEVEQFATAFAAYFQEPEASCGVLNITDLSNETVGFLRKYVICPFEEKKDGV